MGSLLFSGCRKRKGDQDLVDMLSSLKFIAVDPCDDGDDRIEADREWKRRILRARKVLFLKMNDVSNVEEFPFRKKLKSHKFLRTPNDGLDCCHMLNNPIRRSQRTLLKLGNSELIRKRIPIGSTFQADVPDWTDSPINKVGSDYKSMMMGTKIWPVEDDDRNISKEMCGTETPYSCDCISRGSVECIKFHVSMARLHLKSDLGPAFFSLGFAKMGEEVSKLWTQEEQMKFDGLVRQNPTSEGKSFLEPALKYFTSKSRKDIVSFYFNVFVLRWMSMRTRIKPWRVCSSDDESLGWRMKRHDPHILKNGFLQRSCDYYIDFGFGEKGPMHFD